MSILKHDHYIISREELINFIVQSYVIEIIDQMEYGNFPGYENYIAQKLNIDPEVVKLCNIDLKALAEKEINKRGYKGF